MQGLNTEEKGLEIRYTNMQNQISEHLFILFVIIISDYHYALYVH
jgi:hypothetical protein